MRQVVGKVRVNLGGGDVLVSELALEALESSASTQIDIGIEVPEVVAPDL